MSRPRAFLHASAVALVALTGCHRAPRFDGHAIPRTRGDFGTELRWKSEDIVLEAMMPQASAGVPPEAFVAALRDEAKAWDEATAGCDVPRIFVTDTASHGAARVDGRNVVTLRTDDWKPTDLRGDFAGYDPNLEAVTHLRPPINVGAPYDGDVREADIEINAVKFRWSLDGKAPNTRSLRAVLAHELGHVLGLDHVCAKPGERAGDEKPDCAGPEHATLAASIMYPDPTEAGRALVLEPGDDALSTLCAPRTRTAVP